MFARSLNMPAHCGMEPFRQSWHFHLKSCKLVLPERSCGHRGEHQSNNFWKLLTGPPFAGDVPLQALVFSNSLSMHQTLYHHSLSTFSPSFFPLHPQQTQTIPDSPSQPHATNTVFSSILHCFGTASLSPFRLPSRHNNLELHLNNSGTNTNTIPPQIYLYHSELSTAHGDPPDQSASALLGNPLYIYIY